MRLSAETYQAPKMKCVLALVLFSIFVARFIVFYASASETLGPPKTSMGWHMPGTSSLGSISTDDEEDEMWWKDVESDDVQLFLNEESVAVSRVLDWFVGRLKSFVNNERFKNEAFEEGVDFMRKDLDTITRKARLISGSAVISMQLQFATYFFLNMEDSANVLRMYRHYRTEFDMVNWIVYIHLTLLRLLDLRGIPDSTTPGYVEILVRLRRLLVFWGSVFSELRHVPHSVATVFEDKLSLAEKVLIYLEQHNSSI